MFRRNTIGILFLVILAAAAGLYWAVNQAPRAAASPAVQTPVLPVAEAPAVLSHAVQVLGAFIAPHQAALTFKGSGRIAEIRVKEGALVKQGDTLAVLETTELQLAVQQAQAALAGVQARLSQAKAPSNIIAAQAALAAAQKNYDKLSAGPTASDLAAAQAALAAAQRSYNLVRAGPTRDQLAQLKAQVDNAQAALNQAQAAYDKIGGATNPYIGLYPQSLQLQTATNNYTAALGAYNNALSHPTDAELAAAWGQVEQAQAALNRLTPDAAQLAAAQAQVQQAQAALGGTSDNTAAAQAAVDQAQAVLALAQQQVTNATLTAPFDGTVLTIGPHAGEMAGPTVPVMTLADLTHLQLQGGLDQSALEQVRTGQAVTIVPDAFKDKTLTGKVSEVGWTASTVGGVVSVPLTIDVDPTDIPLRPGLSASALIRIDNQND
jgi:HlyD family secretion protein